MFQAKVIAIYGLTDDLLPTMNYSQHSNRAFSDSQMITTALISALYFRGNQTMALDSMDSHVFTKVIKKSGFTKRLHRLKANLMAVLLPIGRILKCLHCQLNYIIDSFPVKACHNLRINRCKLFKGEGDRGYNASKREYF